MKNVSTSILVTFMPVLALTFRVKENFFWHVLTIGCLEMFFLASVKSNLTWKHDV